MANIRVRVGQDSGIKVPFGVPSQGTQGLQGRQGTQGLQGQGGFQGLQAAQG